MAIVVDRSMYKYTRPRQRTHGHSVPGRAKHHTKPPKQLFPKFEHKFKPMGVPKVSYRRDDSQSEYKSVEATTVDTSKKQSNQYTGSLVKGIATLHKSNAVPVIDQQQAEDIAKMRR